MLPTLPKPVTLLLAALASSPVLAQTLTTELVGEGFAGALYAVSPPGDLDRLFIVEQDWGIRILDLNTGLAHPARFLDMAGQVALAPHQGVLGLAFHPDYATNGRFFVNFVDTTETTRVNEYHVSADPDLADPTVVQTIFSVLQPDSLHNGGCLQFGADGKLYVSTGDGGPSGDPDDRGQDLTTPLGKLLRFDVDIPAPFIPADNPFVGGPEHPAIWAYGLRSPWRFSFDRLTGDMYLGDVGQSMWEEVDFQPASSTGGENYGWRCREGAHDFLPQSCPPGASLVEPIHEYPHIGGACVIGGYVYRGGAIPNLAGTYFYADFPSSDVWSFRYDGANLTELTNRSAELDPTGATFGVITSMGEGGSGELYIVSRNPSRIHRIVQDCDAGGESYCVSSPNAAGPGAFLSSSGSLRIAANDFRLEVTGATPNNFGLFFYGHGATQSPQGNGVLCVDSSGGGPFRLYPAVQLDMSGAAVRDTDFTAPPMSTGASQITAGSTYYFQFWYRDPAGPGPTDYNFSDALAATFCP